MLVRETAGGVDQQYLYTADDERIATIQGTGWTWTVRDLGGKVQRTFTSTNGTGTYGDTGFQWAEDYVWRDGLLLASESPSGTRHYHLDHLGTPRLVTNGSGVKIGFHSYYPFGAELAMTTTETPTELMKFTGHQRDLLAADVHTLDYMHARHFQFATGRFLSIDPIHGSLRAPQSWNRYAYVRNSPLVFADPRGMQQLVITGRTGDEADSSLIDPLSQTVNSFLSFHWALDIANSGINWVKAHPVQTGFYAANAALFVASDGSSAVAEAGAAEVIVDTNVLIAAIEGGEGATVDAALAGSTPVAPLTVISEYAVKGSAESASRWLLARGGRVVADVPASSAARLVGKAASAGRVLNAADARVAGAAAERGIGVLTRDIRLRGVLEVLGIKSTGF
jgi:RHS repeat-associated protein